MFVGRSGELSRLHASWSGARAGAISIVEVVGPGGIGKTALVNRFLREHEGDALVLQGAGDELERSLSYGVIAQMLRSAPSGALSIDVDDLGDGSLDPVTVGAHVLDAAAAAPRDVPLLLIVDDAQWCDSASLEAIGFALRRLRSDPVMAVFVLRADAQHPLPAPLERLFARNTADVIDLQGLTQADLEQLNDAEGLDLSRAFVARVLEHTAGNPLYAGAMLRHARSAAAAAPWTPLPAPQQFAVDIHARYEGCSGAARRLAAALSVLGMHESVSLVGDVAEIDDRLPAVDALVDAGIASYQVGNGSELSFVHPLVRSAIYHGLGAAERAGLHARASAIVEDPAAALFHRLAASDGPDPRLAAETGEYARLQATLGNLDAAAAAYSAASDLALDPRDRERYRVESFECRLATGDVSAAEAIVQRVEPTQRSRSYLEGCLALVGGQGVEGETLLHDVVESPDAEEWLRGRAAGQLAPYLVNQGRGTDAIVAAQRCSALSPDELPPWSIPMTSLQISLVQLGRVAEALEIGASTERHSDADVRTLDTIVGRGIIRRFVDDLPGARADLGFAYQVGRRRGPLILSLVAVIHLTEAEYRAGAWDSAVAHGELAASMAEDTDQHWVAAIAHGVAAMPLAGRGFLSAAESHVARARQYATAVRDPASVLWAVTADALVAHANGEPDRIVRALEPLTLMTPDGIEEPGIQPWRALLSEALVHLGRLDDAEGVLTPLEHWAYELDRLSSIVAAARVRGQLEHARGCRDAADEAFGRGERVCDRLPHEFDRAVFDLARGRFLRRTRRRRAATEALRAARDRFRALGALPYLQWCESELSPLGVGAPVRQTEGLLDLTPQELAIAHLVSEGMTNREVASELFLSVKTVEYHLAKAFTKLGVSSRTQLAMRIGETLHN